jgi:hypothetical protein
MIRLDRSPPPTVTPDVFRGLPGRERTVSTQAFLLAAKWTPEQVRGDGVGLAGAEPPGPGIGGRPALSWEDYRIGLR